MQETRIESSTALPRHQWPHRTDGHKDVSTIRQAILPSAVPSLVFRQRWGMPPEPIGALVADDCSIEQKAVSPALRWYIWGHFLWKKTYLYAIELFTGRFESPSPEDFRCYFLGTRNFRLVAFLEKAPQPQYLCRFPPIFGRMVFLCGFD